MRAEPSSFHAFLSFAEALIQWSRPALRYRINKLSSKLTAASPLENDNSGKEADFLEYLHFDYAGNLNSARQQTEVLSRSC